MPEGAKDVLQTGSVVEREFSYELIKRVTGLPDTDARNPGAIAGAEIPKQEARLTRDDLAVGAANGRVGDGDITDYAPPNGHPLARDV